MDLSCSIRTSSTKWHCIACLTYAIFGGGFRIAYAKSNRTGCDLRTRFEFYVLNSNFDGFCFTGCDLRTRFAYAICVLDSNFAYSIRVLRTRLEYLSYFSNQTRCDLRTQFEFSKRRTTMSQESRTHTFLNVMPCAVRTQIDRLTKIISVVKVQCPYAVRARSAQTNPKTWTGVRMRMADNKTCPLLL